MGIRALGSIVGKDFKIFTRSRISSAIIILAPLLIILFAGTAFNSSKLTDVTVGVYSENYTQMTENILTDFSQNYKIEKLNSLEDCINSVKLTKSQICVKFPGDLSQTGSLKNVTFYVDYSRINLAYTLIHQIETKISDEASDIGTVMAQDLITLLETTKTNLPEEKNQLSDSIEKLKDTKQFKKSADLILRTRIENLLSFVEKYFKDLSVESLHDVRIALRRVRYSMELFIVCYDKKIFIMKNHKKNERNNTNNQ